MSAQAVLNQLPVVIYAALPARTCTPLHVFGLVLAAVVWALLWPVVWPATETLDVETETGSVGGEQRTGRRQGSVVLGGSFNPPHKGHVAMLAHLSRRYEKVPTLV